MDSKGPGSNSRINSPARVRRRVKIKEKANPSGTLLYTDADANGTRAQFAASEGNVDFHNSLRNKKASIIADRAQAMKNTLHNNFSYASLDNEFGSKASLSEKMSDSSAGSHVTALAQMSSTGQKMQSAMKQQDKLKILATLLPDEVLRDPISKKGRAYNIALMFPDVSGFTQLCEKYDKTGKGGPSRLTEVLNGYIGSMIQIVLSRNGDVCKFGGDAFLCMWKVSSESDIMEIVHLAIESAVDIQKNCGEHSTDVGVKLGVKIAVSAGKALFSIIGTESRKHYVVVGPPVMDVHDAEQLCRPGDVIVAPSAWKYVENYMLYSYTYHSNNMHIKVHDFGPLWKSAKRGFKLDQGSKMATNPRPFLKHSLRFQVDDIRPFILPPVMKSIELNQSLDYLTEMRQVAIVFFNVAADFGTMPLEDIIELSNKAFQIVCGYVDKNDGTVNKLTLFDKDMAILVVFGLKGFKHELASQVALKCAYNCLEQLKKLQVYKASAGVTTGMAYCGVIGHTFRREYTVMGHPVNMAARLMCAYENIVSSDRDTFLHSKLESGHFEVLEHKLLKGIQNSGPFYKFHLYPKRTKLKLDHQAYPLLGRAKEIEEFEQFLLNSERAHNIVNFMVIFGKARIGKSRLVAKLINIAEKQFYSGTENRRSRRRRKSPVSGLEICFIPLTEDDSKYSYSASRLILQPPLGLSETSSVEEREDKIVAKMGEVRDVFLLPSLNPVFNVNFDLMPQYLSLTEEEQAEAQRTMVRNLYSKCFPKGTRWLIVIEDAEFMDEESWNVLKWCANESHWVLYLLTIGQRKVLSPAAMDCLAFVNCRKITLTEIEKWHYAGLACQILGVRAIHLDIVNLLQSYKSSGNPGWLESFLLSLIQSGSIYIRQVSSHQLKSMGLVTAPDVTFSPKQVQEKYEASNWLDCVETFQDGNNSEDSNIRVCLVGSKFYENSEKETELTMDVMLIKTIDTLKPVEQLVLKAGSVLGNNFKRSALKFVMSKDSQIEERQLAKAIKNLFEIKILTCAKGDFTQSNLLAPRRMILVTSIRREVTCECTGVIIPEDCRDMPGYASCGYMQFRSPSFRDTVYNLLLDEQKKKYHNSSIEFLRKNTYKCKACKSVPFDNVLGYEVNDQVTLVCTVTPMHGVRSTKLEPKTILPQPSPGQKLIGNPRQAQEDPQNFETEFGSNLYRDVGECQCSEILASVYSVLLEHAAGSGRKDIMLEIQLEYASVSLTSYNIPLTMQILEDALALVNQMKEDKEYPEFCTPYIYGKIYTLMGATKLSMGRPDNSLEFLETSLKYMNRSLPTTTTKVKLLIKRENIKRRLMMEFFPEKYIGRASNQKAPPADLLSECFGLISNVHMYMQNWLMAKYASLCALNKALESNRNFFGLCTAYTNMMDVAYHDNDVETCAKMEVCAIDICRRCTRRISEVYELEAVCRLYRVIFLTRHVRAEIEAAVLLGFQSIKIASIIRNTSLRLDMMPDLISALIQLNRLSEAASLLQELEFLSLLDSDKSSRMWYYAICLDFQLDTGFTVLPYDRCQQFVKEEEENLTAVRDPNAMHRLYTSLWLWCLRNDEWELSKPYTKTLKNFNIMDGGETPCSVFTRLKRLEGFLITLVHRMDTRNIYAVTATYSEIHSLMNRLERDMKVVKLLKPRYLLLQAYYRQIRYRDERYNRILSQALSLAEKMKDKNTSEWIIHLKMVWGNAISPIQRDYWMEHCRYNLIDWHESEGATKKQTVMYSLPLPKF